MLTNYQSAFNLFTYIILFKPFNKPFYRKKSHKMNINHQRTQKYQVLDPRLNQDISKTSAFNIMGRTTKVSPLRSNKEAYMLRWFALMVDNQL